MRETRDIITEGFRCRMRKSENEEQVKVRQPLASLTYAGEKLPEEYEQMIAEEVNVKMVKRGKETALNKKLTQALKEEGYARELIRVVQSARKKAGLNVDDRIKLYVSCDLNEQQKQMVMAEVLATELNESENFAYDEIAKVNGKQVTISLERV